MVVILIDIGGIPGGGVVVLVVVLVVLWVVLFSPASSSGLPRLQIPLKQPPGPPTPPPGLPSMSMITTTSIIEGSRVVSILTAFQVHAVL